MGMKTIHFAIAVFPILADVVKVKTGSRSIAHWSNDFIQLNGWLRNNFAQLITPLDIDGIGQNWEDSNIPMYFFAQTSRSACVFFTFVQQTHCVRPNEYNGAHRGPCAVAVTPQWL